MNVCFRAAGLCAVALALPSQASAERGAAQPVGYVLALGRSQQPTALAELQPLLEAALGGTLTSLASPPGARPEGEVKRDQLAVLVRAEQALVQARELTAQFREGAALQVLWEAEQLLMNALDVPGVHSYLAEVDVQLALCAAQLGQMGLFESALSRAASLDPGRHLEAAEAPPAVLALAQQIARARETAQLSEQELQVTPSEAERWLDGERLPAGPLRARSGEHVLVIRAPGHVPYATLLRLEPGVRRSQRIELAAEPLELARRALLANADRLATASAYARQIAELSAQPVYLVELVDEQAARGLAYRCDARSCRAALAVTAERVQKLHGEPGARAWLSPAKKPDAASQHQPRWRRWPVWAASAAAVAIGVTTALLVRRTPPAREERVLEVQPAPLPP